MGCCACVCVCVRIHACVYACVYIRTVCTYEYTMGQVWLSEVGMCSQLPVLSFVSVECFHHLYFPYIFPTTLFFEAAAQSTPDLSDCDETSTKQTRRLSDSSGHGKTITSSVCLVSSLELCKCGMLSTFVFFHTSTPPPSFLKLLHKAHQTQVTVMKLVQSRQEDLVTLLAMVGQ